METIVIDLDDPNIKLNRRERRLVDHLKSKGILMDPINNNGTSATLEVNDHRSTESVPITESVTLEPTVESVPVVDSPEPTDSVKPLDQSRHAFLITEKAMSLNTLIFNIADPNVGLALSHKQCALSREASRISSDELEARLDALTHEVIDTLKKPAPAPKQTLAGFTQGSARVGVAAAKAPLQALGWLGGKIAKGTVSVAKAIGETTAEGYRKA